MAMSRWLALAPKQCIHQTIGLKEKCLKNEGSLQMSLDLLLLHLSNARTMRLAIMMKMLLQAENQL